MNTRLFPPSKRGGLIFHGILLVVLLLTSIWGFINLSRQAVGLNFVIYLLVGLIAFAPLPFLGYRAFALFAPSTF